MLCVVEGVWRLAHLGFYNFSLLLWREQVAELPEAGRAWPTCRTLHKSICIAQPCRSG